MQKKTTLRIVLDILLFTFASLGFWWLVYPIGIITSWYYKKYYEFIAACLVIDIIYSTSRAHVFGFKYIFSLFGILAFILVINLKNRIRK